MSSPGKSPSELASSRHVPELDGVRGLAILMVMCLHFVCSMFSPQNTLERLAVKLTSYGTWGVDLFFVLSGFLITGILYDTRESPRFFSAFYGRRTLRIFPLYYAVLFVLFVLIPSSWLREWAPGLLEAKELQAWVWTYLTNVYVAREGSFSIPYISHFWSLAIEEHFYLVWPFVVRYLPRVALMRACVALSVFALVSRLWLLRLGFSEIAVYVLTPCRLDALCTGAWFALAARAPAAAAGQQSRKWAFVGVGVAIVLLSAIKDRLGGLAPMAIGVRGSLLALFFGLFIASAADGSSRARPLLRLRALTLLGKYSYGLYVFHGIIAHAMLSGNMLDWFVAVFGSRTLGIVFHTIAGAGVSIAVAVASYELFEVRFLKLKKSFQATPRKLPAVEPNS